MIGELLKQAEIYISEGLHPRVITSGFDLAKKEAIKFLDFFKIQDSKLEKSTLLDICKTALKTKINRRLADHMAEICVDAIESIKPADKKPVDLHMIEIMEMQHRSETDTQLIKGLVLDHGARHPDMKKSVSNAFILTCNVSA